jgi:hypothetical protein
MDVFVVDLTSESGQHIQEMSLFLSYMIFKSVETARPHDVKSVNPDAIEKAYRESESWIEWVSQAGHGQLQSAISSGLERDAEPFLLQYVIAELNQSFDDGTELNDEEKGEVFFVLRTVISSLSHNRSIIEAQ